MLLHLSVAKLILLLALCSQLKKYRILFLRFTHEDLKAQKYLLGGIEQVIALHKDTLLPKVPGIFKVIIIIIIITIHPSALTSEIQCYDTRGGDEKQSGW